MPEKNTTRKSKSHPPKTVKKRSIRPKDLYSLVYISDPQISPDGKTVLFTRKVIGEKHEYLTNLWVVSTDRGTPQSFSSSGKDRLGRWSPDGSSIAFVSDRDESQPQIYTIPVDGGEATKLTNFPEGSIASFAWSPDGTMLAVKYRQTDEEHTEATAKKRKESGEKDSPYIIDDFYYRFDGDGYFNAQRHRLDIVDVKTGEHRLLYDKDNIGWFKYDWSPDSKELVVAANTEKNALIKFWKWNLFRVNAKTGKASRIPNIPTSLKLKVLWSPDGKRIAFAGHEGSACWGVENSRIYVCKKDGSELQDLTGKHDYCFSASTISDSQEMSWEEDFVWSRDGKNLFASVAWQGATHIVSLSTKDGSIETLTKGRKTFSMRNLSADGKSLAMMTSDFLNPAEIALGEISKSGKSHTLKVSSLTHFNRGLLKKLELTPAEPTWIRSIDGNRVQVWTMFPSGSSKKKKRPAILTVHGGPHCQYGESFFHELQVYSAAGYAVVFCNPRGSKGYGEEHCTSIRGNWGQADWRDIQAVTEFMKSHPQIDSNKMAVVGGSYGGYMTNWVISHTNDFAAAVTDRCVSNLVSMVGTSDLPLVPGEYWHGNSWDNIEELWEQSPLKHFGNVKTPTLVIHSEGDLRCNIEQSEQIFAALKLRGIPTRFVRYPRSTSHGLSRCGPPNLRIHRLKQYLGWFDKYLH